jgi:hypothetical protein
MYINELKIKITLKEKEKEKKEGGRHRTPAPAAGATPVAADAPAPAPALLQPFPLPLPPLTCCCRSCYRCRRRCRCRRTCCNRRCCFRCRLLLHFARSLVPAPASAHPAPALAHVRTTSFVPTRLCVRFVLGPDTWSLLGCAGSSLFVLVPATCLFACPAVRLYPLGFARTPPLCTCAHPCSLVLVPLLACCEFALVRAPSSACSCPFSLVLPFVYTRSVLLPPVCSSSFALV